MTTRVHVQLRGPVSPPRGQPTSIVEVAPPQLVVSLALDRADDLEAAALIAVMRRERFDLRRRMFLAFVVDFAARRDSAYAAVASDESSGWDTALYGDSSGWVVRLSRTRRLTRDAVSSDISEVKRLALRFRGEIRGVTVEDLRDEDRWAGMASRLQEQERRQSDASQQGIVVPAPRAPMEPMSGGA